MRKQTSRNVPYGLKLYRDIFLFKKSCAELQMDTYHENRYSTFFAIFFAALLMRAYPKSSGVLLPCRTSGKFFSLSRHCVKSIEWRFLTRERLYAGDAAFVATSALVFKNICSFLPMFVLNVTLM